MTEAQAKLFYDLWIPLLDFVNRKYKLPGSVVRITQVKYKLLLAYVCFRNGENKPFLKLFS